MVCLDTDLLVDFLRQKRGAVGKLQELQDLQVPLHTTPITASELYRGAYKSGHPLAIKTTEELLNRLTLLDFNQHAAQSFGAITTKLEKDGRKLDDLDALIGAICMAHGEPIVTRNVKHFERIENLSVQSW